MFKNNPWIRLSLFGVFCSVASLSAIPREISDDLLNEFTLYGKIPVSYQPYDYSNLDQTACSLNLLDLNVQKATLRQNGFLGETDFHLYNALDDLSAMILGKKVAIIGSHNAWYESILLAYGGEPIVIVDNHIQSTDSRITYLTQEEYSNNPQQFDLIISMTDTANAGFGHHGGDIDPNGDLKLMEGLQKMLTPIGKLLLAIPVGPDQLIWNTHRIYGEIRLKQLLKGWKVVRYYGFTSEYMFYGIGYQPVFLLQPK